MKILTKEEEEEHNRTTWEGGLLGSLGGLALGSAGIVFAGRRFPAFRSLGLPFRGFLAISSTAFCGVITADRYSRSFEKARHDDSDYQNTSESAIAAAQAQKDTWSRTKEWVSEQRYPIVFGSWVASMIIAFGLVSRNKHQSGQQKLVQARVYAQGLTIAVLIASFALESNDLRAGKGRWETIKVVDPNDPEHKKLIDKRIHHEAYQGEDQWMDMIESQERKMKARGEKIYDGEQKGGKKSQSKEEGAGVKSAQKTGQSEKKGDSSAEKETAPKKDGGKKESAKA